MKKLRKDLEVIKSKKILLGVSKHTFKSQMIILPNSRNIVDIIAGESGPKSDIVLFQVPRNNFDPKQEFREDLGYIGKSLIDTPIKKPKNGELIINQRKENKEFFI